MAGYDTSHELYKVCVISPVIGQWALQGMWTLLSLVSELYKVCELSCHWSVSSTRYRYRYVNSPVIGQWALQGTGMWTLLSLVSELYKVRVCELSCHWSMSSTRYRYVNSPVIGQSALQVMWSCELSCHWSALGWLWHLSRALQAMWTLLSLVSELYKV